MALYPGATTFPGPTTYPSGTTVVPEPDGLIVSLAEAKAHLNITSTRNDVELLMYLEAATAVIEAHVGAVVPRTLTETVYGRLLSHAPALAVTAVDHGGVAYTGTYVLNSPAGLLDGVPYGATVTYTVGRTPIPAAIRLAALVVVARMWETQRGSQPLPVSGGGDDQPTYVSQAGADLPYRAQMLLAPYRQARGLVA